MTVAAADAALCCTCSQGTKTRLLGVLSVSPAFPYLHASQRTCSERGSRAAGLGRPFGLSEALPGWRGTIVGAAGTACAALRR